MSNNLPVLREYFEGGEPIEIRASDGYWNATEMCQKYGKRINNFLRAESTKAYLEALSEVTLLCAMYQGDTLRCPDTGYLVLVKQSGTWVHPQVALKLAAWLNPRFEVWVYSTIEKLLTEGKVELQEQLACYEKMLDAALYDRDELRRDLPWHRQNSWGAAMDDVDPYS